MVIQHLEVIFLCYLICSEFKIPKLVFEHQDSIKILGILKFFLMVSQIFFVFFFSEYFPDFPVDFFFHFFFLSIELTPSKFRSKLATRCGFLTSLIWMGGGYLESCGQKDESELSRRECYDCLFIPPFIYSCIPSWIQPFFSLITTCCQGLLVQRTQQWTKQIVVSAVGPGVENRDVLPSLI